MPLPVVTLRVEAAMINPPKPMGFIVLDEGGKMIGVATVEEVRRALARFDEMASKSEPKR